jgi:hypothetical protein
MFSDAAMGEYNAAKKRKKDKEDDPEGFADCEDEKDEKAAGKDMKGIIKRLNRLEFVQVLQEDRLSNLEAWATRTWMFPKEHALSKKVMEAMEEWKQLRPKRGPHPMGPPRTSVAMAVVNYLTDLSKDDAEALKVFKVHVQNEGKEPKRLGDVTLQMGSGRLTKPQKKDGEETKEAKFLLQLRPANIGTAAEAWKEAFKMIDKMMDGDEGVIMLTDKAPPVGASRDMKKEVNKRGKGKGKGKDKAGEEEE